jgi:hypothetical protein
LVWLLQFGYSSLVTSVWLQQFVYSSLVTAVWLQQFVYSSLVTAVWLQQFGYSSLFTTVWLQQFGYGSLATAVSHKLMHCVPLTAVPYTQTSLRAVALHCKNTCTEQSKLTPISSQMNVLYELTVTVTMDTLVLTRMLTSRHRQDASTIVLQTT